MVKAFDAATQIIFYLNGVSCHHATNITNARLT